MPTPPTPVRKLYHCCYALSYHFVFVTKYRRPCLTDAMLVRLREIVTTLCDRWQGRLVELNAESDHLHLLLKLNPRASPAITANNLKTVTSRLLRKEFEPELRHHYKDRVLWSRSYFVASCGGAPLAIIRRYIEQQATD